MVNIMNFPQILCFNRNQIWKYLVWPIFMYTTIILWPEVRKQHYWHDYDGDDYHGDDYDDDDYDDDDFDSDDYDGDDSREYILALVCLTFQSSQLYKLTAPLDWIQDAFDDHHKDGADGNDEDHDDHYHQQIMFVQPCILASAINLGMSLLLWAFTSCNNLKLPRRKSITFIS